MTEQRPDREWPVAWETRARETWELTKNLLLRHPSPAKAEMGPASFCHLLPSKRHHDPAIVQIILANSPAIAGQAEIFLKD